MPLIDSQYKKKNIHWSVIIPFNLTFCDSRKLWRESCLVIWSGVNPLKLLSRSAWSAPGHWHSVAQVAIRPSSAARWSAVGYRVFALPPWKGKSVKDEYE